MDEDRRDEGRAKEDGLSKLGGALFLFALVVILIIVVGGLGYWLLSEFGEIVAWFVVGLLTLAVACGLFWFLPIALTRWEAYRFQRAETLQRRREADHVVVTAGPLDQVFVKDYNHDYLWNPAHLQSTSFDGSTGQPTDDEQRMLLAHKLASAAGGGKEARKILDQPEISVEPGEISLLLEVQKYDRSLLVGGSGSGKTTLMQHMVEAQRGQVIVFDPHDDGVTWPENATVVGGGEDWKAIADELQGLMELKSKRYKERFDVGKQPGEFDPLFFVADEWRNITQNCENAPPALKMFLTDLRKVNMGMVIMSQSDRAEALGLKGSYDLLDGFEAIVRLLGNKKVGFSANVETINGEYEVIPPGPYAPQLTARGEAYQTGQSKAPLSSEDQLTLDLWDGGERSKTRIGKRVFGSKGGWQNERVTEVLKKHRGVNI